MMTINRISAPTTAILIIVYSGISSSIDCVRLSVVGDSDSDSDPELVVPAPLSTVLPVVDGTISSVVVNTVQMQIV